MKVRASLTSLPVLTHRAVIPTLCPAVPSGAERGGRVEVKKTRDI